MAPDFSQPRLRNEISLRKVRTGPWTLGNSGKTLGILGTHNWKFADFETMRAESEAERGGKRMRYVDETADA